MIVIACGGRDYADSRAVISALDALHAKKGIQTLLEGGADGADKLARAWAHSAGIDCITVHANWKKHGKAAGPRRNGRMLDLARVIAVAMDTEVGVVAFPGGAGTADMKNQALLAGVLAWEPIK